MTDELQPVVSVSTVYFGPEEEGMALNQPLLDTGPIVQNITLQPWPLAIKQNRFGADTLGCVKGSNHSVYGLNLYSLDVATFVDVFNAFAIFYQDNPTLRVSFLVTELYSSHVTMEIADEETAYPYRGTTAYAYKFFFLFFSCSKIWFYLPRETDSSISGSRTPALRQQQPILHFQHVKGWQQEAEIRGWRRTSITRTVTRGLWRGIRSLNCRG
jgi:hypothetical protein